MKMQNEILLAIVLLASSWSAFGMLVPSVKPPVGPINVPYRSISYRSPFLKSTSIIPAVSVRQKTTMTPITEQIKPQATRQFTSYFGDWSKPFRHLIVGRGQMLEEIWSEVKEFEEKPHTISERVAFLNKLIDNFPQKDINTGTIQSVTQEGQQALTESNITLLMYIILQTGIGTEDIRIDQLNITPEEIESLKRYPDQAGVQPRFDAAILDLFKKLLNKGANPNANEPEKVAGTVMHRMPEYNKHPLWLAVTSINPEAVAALIEDPKFNIEKVGRKISNIFTFKISMIGLQVPDDTIFDYVNQQINELAAMTKQGSIEPDKLIKNRILLVNLQKIQQLLSQLPAYINWYEKKQRETQEAIRTEEIKKLQEEAKKYTASLPKEIIISPLGNNIVKNNFDEVQRIIEDEGVDAVQESHLAYAYQT